MAIFHSERERLSYSQDSKNPWAISSTYIHVGSLGKVISLAERTGQLPKVKEREDKIMERTKKCPSVKLIEQLEKKRALKKELYKVKEMIYNCHLQQEYKDLTDPSILAEKTRRMEELSLHFSAIVDKKDELIKRLQQPFVGDYISIDAEHHKYVADAIPCLASVLSNLNTFLEIVTWSTQFTLEDGEMKKILDNVSSVLAQMQSFHQSLSHSRNIMSRLLNEARKSVEK